MIKKSRATRFLLISVFLFQSIFISACGSEFAFFGPTEELPLIDPPFICDPFSNDQGDHLANGIQGDVYYRGKGQPAWENVESYMAHGIPLGVPIFLNEIFVPTRLWNRGFTASNGARIENEDGELLLEYFGIRLRSQLALSDEDEVGLKQFAILSDDGAKLRVKIPGEGPHDATSILDELYGNVIVDNDGVHPTRMGCAERPVNFEENTLIPMTLDYYQGPRSHISLVLMWRPWPTEMASNDPLCGAMGNNLFFNPHSEDFAPQQAYLDLLDRGWRPISPNNFYLPDEKINPCSIEAE